MKKTVILLFLVLMTSLTSLAASPPLACESLFSEKNKTNPNVSITIINSPGNCFRSITVTNDKSVVAEIERMVKKDRERATNIIEEYKGGAPTEFILNVPTGSYIISIGYTRKSDSSAELFISGPPKAFR